MKSRLALRISGSIIVVITFALTLTALLNYYKFEKTFGDVVHSRYLVRALDIKDTIESGMNLGLSLAEFDDIQQVIVRAQRREERLSSIEVFDETVMLIYSTRHATAQEAQLERSSRSDGERQRLLDAALGSEGRQWRIDDGDTTGIGVTVFNNFDKPVGAVLLQYDNTRQHRALAYVARTLGAGFAVGMAVLLGLTIIAVMLLSRRMTRRLERMSASIERVASEEDPTFGDDDARTVLSQEFVRFQTATRQAIEEIQDVERELGRADAGGAQG